MNEEKKELKQFSEMSFEEIFEQNERRIHYHIHRLGIRDPYEDFYAEGLFAMWMAYQKYEPQKGPLATYFNYIIRNRLIDMIRKNIREQEKEESFVEHKKKQYVNDLSSEMNHGTMGDAGSEMEETEMLQEVKSKLTKKQWDWVYYHIILDWSLKEIAEMRGVSVEAVKGWGKEVRRKLRKESVIYHLK